MSSDATEAKRKRESPDEKPGLKSDAVIQQEEKCSPPASKRQKGVADSDSDSDCISQEDLLAQLGLNSVKRLKAEEANSKRIIHPEPPKQSILEFLRGPVVSKKVLTSAPPRKEKPLLLTNGSLEEDDEEDGGGEDIDNKEKLIMRLQNNLRNEEAKLLLLRKLYACQNDKGSKEPTPARTAIVTTTSTTHAQPSATVGQRKTTLIPKITKPHQSIQSPAVQPRVVFLSQPRGQHVVIAPKLVPVSSKSSHDTTRDSTHRNVRPLLVSAGPNTPTKSMSTSTASSGTKVMQRPQPVHPTTIYAQSSISNTTNKSPALRTLPSVHIGSDKFRASENGLPKVLNAVNIVHSPSPPQQSHAEAKLALRKQLERTLLQIPPPKPPAQDWSFVPSVNTQDFTILIGLQGVVNHVLESKEMSSKAGDDKPVPVITPPRFCSQCDTDFAPAWRKKPLDDGSKLVTLCESCYTQKIKKTLKTEHTARLKAAFVKALKQEQEVEQKFQASGAVQVASKTGKPDASKTQTVRASTHHQIRQAPPRIIYHPPPVHHSLQPQVYQPHHSIVHQLQQQQLQQQHQELESAHRQETRYFTYVGQHNCQPQHKQRHNYAGDNDRQREYLLDMIPSGHSSRGYRI